MQQMILIRGVPGSGKSTLAKLNFKDHIHIEADMYFITDGIYQYDKTKVQDAHRWCKFETEKAIRNGDNVVVANTFTRIWELLPYIQLATDYSIEFRIITCTNLFENIHDVPNETITIMNDRFEKFPIEEFFEFPSD